MPASVLAARPAQARPPTERGARDHLIDRVLHQATQADHGASGQALTSVRTVSAARTLATVRPWLDRVGVDQVRELSLPGVPACPVVQVVRGHARSDYFNAGKGYSLVEALVSGLMEALEVDCYERASAQRLHTAAGPGMPAGLPTDAPRLHAQDLVGDLPEARLADAPPRPGARPAADWWLPGTELLGGQRVWLPAALCTRELPDGATTPASPNGVASGNRVSEAALHALCELLERHGLARFLAGRPLVQEWVAPTPEQAQVQAGLAQLRALGIRAHFLLVSQWAGVPVFVCWLVFRTAQGQAQAVQGFGAHLLPPVAMARALAEAVQLLALCPPAGLHQGLAGGGNRQGLQDSGPQALVTSKQAALLSPATIAHQRRQAHDHWRGLQALGPAVPWPLLLDSPRLPSPASGPGADPERPVATALDLVLDGLRREGQPRAALAVISPPAWPVVVVKAFCPGLDSVPGL